MAKLAEKVAEYEGSQAAAQDSLRSRSFHYKEHWGFDRSSQQRARRAWVPFSIPSWLRSMKTWVCFKIQIPPHHAVIFEKSPLVHNLLLCSFLYFETLLSACNFTSIISAPFRCRINLKRISRTTVLDSFSLEHFVDIEIPFMIWGKFFFFSTQSAVIRCDCHSEQGKPQGLKETWSPFPDIFSRD